MDKARQVRQIDRASTSVFHQGQKQYASNKVRMYDCNLYQFSKSTMNSLAKQWASMYAH
jgi:hypothetical protein